MADLDEVPLVHEEEQDELSLAERLQEGTALCLSGGGYRAMLFHLGALWYLNEQRLLGRIARFSSVSGGSITSAVLGWKWRRLQFDDGGRATNFATEVGAPIRELASVTIDTRAVLRGLLPFDSIGDRLTAFYRERLFGDATLQDLPEEPRFVINATNLQSGVLFRFSQPFIWDYRVGKIARPELPLAAAVAASSAFPPILSPVKLRFRHEDFVPGTGEDLQRPPYTTDVVLTDGGVYDNLGIETAWKLYDTILVSDAGSRMDAERYPRANWLHHSLRTLAVIDNQVRSLRKRQLVESFREGVRKGTYWSTRSNADAYGIESPFELARERTMELALIPTRLAAMKDDLQKRLINWGFAISDLAVRRHLDPSLAAPLILPFPDVRI
jgi:NTE family protein